MACVMLSVMFVLMLLCKQLSGVMTWIMHSKSNDALLMIGQMRVLCRFHKDSHKLTAATAHR